MQNILLLVSSYVFYGWWDWRFLLLLILSSTVDFVVGLGLKRSTSEKRRKLILLLSVTFNVTLLGFFKYFNFFVDSFSDLMTQIGVQVNPVSLNVILPVGISFYTFQSLSYTIDVYKRKMEPTENLLTFFAFVSFFPQLVAGPIERAIHMIPQFSKTRTFDVTKATDGLRQILWGLFKKIVIADNLATYVNEAFNNYTDYNGFTLLLGSIFFAFQIYCDFSGYSDIAIGTARLFGFHLMRNFAFPYFSRDIAEFWRKWHISLSTWFRDYVYLPLGGSRVSKTKMIRNTFIVFIVSGFWHGANWTFVVWGFLNALYFLPLVITKSNRKFLDVAAQGKILPSIKEFFQILITFLLAVLAWVFFRANSLSHALEIIQRIFTSFYKIDILELRSLANSFWITFSHVLLLAIFIIAEWLQREKQHALEFDSIKMPRVLRWGIYYLVVFIIFYFTGSQQSFIYFQF